MGHSARLNDAQKDVLMKEGSFHGVRVLLQRNMLTDAEASAILSKSFGAILLQVDEAKKEMQHIQNALARMESICRSGKQSKQGQVGDQSHKMLGDTVVALDNWIVSLMETNLTITGMLNPSLTRSKIIQFGKAMNALMDRRASEKHPVLDDPSLFSGYVNW